MPREFIQENDIDFSKYNGGNNINTSLVTGEFNGSYNAQGRGIFSLKLKTDEIGKIGIFESIGGKASVSNLRVVSPSISGNGDLGVITAVNKGKIKGVVIEKPTLTGTARMGSVCGYNKGDIVDVYTIDYGTNEEASFSGGTEIGGITGQNDGRLMRVLYIAKAPKISNTDFPITYFNKGKMEDVYFLSASGYNELHNNIGIAKTTSEFSGIDTINWYEWSEAVSPYPYPFITGIRPPQNFPVAN